MDVVMSFIDHATLVFYSLFVELEFDAIFYPIHLCPSLSVLRIFHAHLLIDPFLRRFNRYWYDQG